MARRVRVNLSIDAAIWQMVREAKDLYGFSASKVAENAFVSQLLGLHSEQLRVTAETVERGRQLGFFS